MPGGYKNIKPEDGKQFSSDYQPESNGRPPSKPLRELLEKLEYEEFTITVPMDNCIINEDSISMKLTSKEFIAYTLQTKAAKDVRWFREWAKVLGEYAPDKHEHTGKDGQPIALEPITGMVIR